jgi:uncharacterized protein (TIGR02145 family)
MKTKQFLLLTLSAIIMGAGFFMSCDSDEPEVPAELVIDKTTVPATVPFIAKTYYVNVTANTAWTVAVSADAGAWCHVSPASGNGNGAITLTIDANAADERTATVTVSAGGIQETISFTQSAATELAVSPPSVTLTVNATTLSIEVYTSSPWTATVTAGADWSRITGAASGTGSGSITLSIDENTTPEARTAIVTFTVAGLEPVTATITQAASACTPPATYTVSTNKENYCSGDEGATIGLDNSQSGVTYVLYKNGDATTVTASGTGAALDFSVTQSTGTYTVRTVGTQTSCEVAMSGSVTVNELQSFNAGAIASVAYTRAAVNHMPQLTFATPAAGVFQYQWLLNGSPIANSNQASFQPNASAGDETLSYTVQVKNACGVTPDAWVDVPGVITVAKVMPACPCAPTTVTLAALAPYSTNITTVGAQQWTDYIKSGSCQAGSFKAAADAGININSPGIVLCRPGAQNQGSLFTYCAIGLFSDQICPAGYHVPSPDEFVALDGIITNGRVTDGAQRRASDANFAADLAKYRTDWGANQSRMCHSNEDGDNGFGYAGDWFWSNKNDGSGNTFQLTDGPGDVNNDYVINPKKSRGEFANGLSIRCIRN